ncbi:hypothetical protein SAMN06309944_0687 [Micrococcales bacterium KH10]|nr:hypothetical protein SAMN06309944_0687 [Micrococcales bacterium KH10]
MTSRYSKRLRAAVSAGTALTLAAIGLGAPAANAAATHAVSNATLAWAYSQYAQYGIFGAWSQAAEGDNVEIKEWNGEEITGLPAEASKTYKGAEFSGGTGTIDEVTGAGEITWADTGDWILNAYSGQFGAPDETLRKPILAIDEGGNGALSFEAYIPAALDMEGNPTEAVGPERIVLATFTDVEFDGTSFQATPEFAGRPYVDESGEVAAGWADCEGVGGSWPSAWINFVPESVRPHYYSTSCGGLQNRKPPTRVDVSFDLGELAGITGQPQNASVEEGKQATFTVAASNPDSDEALTYSWESSTNGETWTAVNGATRASYAVIGRASASGTQYRVKVKNQNGTVTSSAATLTVTAADLDPTVTLSADDFVSDAETVVTVTGTGFDPNYVLGTRPPLAGTSSGVYVAFGKFAENWKPSTGAAGSTRPTADVRWSVLAQDMATIGGEENGAAELRPDGTFELTLTVDRATADNAAAAVASGNYGIYTYPGGGGWQPAFETFTPITFQPLVDITEQPAQRTVAAGGPATFAVAYDSASDASVQWQVSTDDGKTWQDIAGANNVEYKIDQVAASLNGNLYRAKFVNSGGAEYSDSALLVVRIPGLTITGQPAAATSLAVGDSTALAVSASGQFVTYQWQVRAPGTTAWTDVAGATSQRLTVAPTAVAQSGTSYRVVLANPAGEQISATAAVTVTKAASKLNAKLGKKKAKAKKRVKVTATLKTKAANAGKVRVVFKGTKGKAKGKKTTRTVAVKANGKVTVKSAKLRKGKYKVTARYLGTADVSAVKARKIGTVKVR